MHKLVTAFLAAVVGVLAHPSLPKPAPSQVIEARWVKFDQHGLFDEIEMLIALQGVRPPNYN